MLVSPGISLTIFKCLDCKRMSKQSILQTKAKQKNSVPEHSIFCTKTLSLLCQPAKVAVKPAVMSSVKTEWRGHREAESAYAFCAMLASQPRQTDRWLHISVASQGCPYFLALTVQWEAWIFRRGGSCCHVWVPEALRGCSKCSRPLLCALAP